MFGRDQVLTILTSAVRELSNQGLEGEVLFSSSEEQTVRSAWGEINQPLLARSVDITISARIGSKSASVTIGDWNASAVRAAVTQVKELVAFSRDDPYLPDLIEQPKVLPELSLPNLDEETLSHAWDVKAEALARSHYIARGISFDSSGRFFTGVAELGVANTNGLLRYNAFTGASCLFVVTGPDHISACAQRASTNIGDIVADELIEESMKRASLCKSLPSYDPFSGSEKGPQTFDILIHPYALTTWIEWLSYSGFSGLAVHEKQSFLTDTFGEVITGQNITIRDDWTYKGFPQIPFDFEGRTRTQISFIEDGVARGAYYDGRSAKKAQVTSTGHSGGALHMVFEGGDATEEELIAQCERPTVYVTYFNYPSMPHPREGVFTATTRHGTFLIESGKLVNVLPPLRFTEKTLEVFSRVVGLSQPMILMETENYFGFFPQSIAAPFARIENCTFVGSTQYD